MSRWLGLLVAVALVACTSPEADRTRGGGPGADVGNRGNPIVMHEGSSPYADTPKRIPSQAPPVAPASQARQLSRAQ